MILYGHRLKHSNIYLSVVSNSYYKNIISDASKPEYYDFFAYDKLPYNNKNIFENLLPCNLEFKKIHINDLSFEEKLFYNLHQIIVDFVLDKKLDHKTPWWTIDYLFTKHIEKIVYNSYIKNFNKVNNYV